MKTLDQIAEMCRTYNAARDKFREHHATKPKFLDYENETHIRWSIESEKLVTASVKLEGLYRAACDEFFAKGCPDLIQLLVDLDEHFDGQVDIDSNGRPNFAMRCGAQIEAFLGPRPAQQAAE